jgi:hypothetical protein
MGRNRFGAAVRGADRRLLHPSATPTAHQGPAPADQPFQVWLWKGVNFVAFIAVGAGAVTYSLLLNPVSYEPSGLFCYTTC